MSLHRGAERPEPINPLADKLEREERLRVAAHDEVRKFRSLLEPLIQEAAGQQIQIKTSVDPELETYFSNRTGKFRIGFYQDKDDGPIFQPVSESSVSVSEELHHEAVGLLVVLQKDFVGKRPLLPSEKRQATLRFAMEKYLRRNPTTPPIPTETNEPLETYLQGLSFFPGSMWPEEEGTVSAWAVSSNSKIYTASELLEPDTGKNCTPNLYYLVSSPFRGLPPLTFHGTAEEAIDFLKKELLVFSTEVDEKEAVRTEYAPNPTLGEYVRGLKKTYVF